MQRLSHAWEARARSSREARQQGCAMAAPSPPAPPLPCAMPPRLRPHFRVQRRVHRALPLHDRILRQALIWLHHAARWGSSSGCRHPATLGGPPFLPALLPLSTRVLCAAFPEPPTLATSSPAVPPDQHPKGPSAECPSFRPRCSRAAALLHPAPGLAAHRGGRGAGLRLCAETAARHRQQRWVQAGRGSSSGCALRCSAHVFVQVAAGCISMAHGCRALASG